MKVLPLEVTSKGSTYRQVLREGNLAIYSQHQTPTSKPGAYEMIIIKSHNGYTLGGNTVAPAEMYPSDNQFGKLGWCYSTNLYPDAYKAALDKLAQVKQSQEQ